MKNKMKQKDENKRQIRKMNNLSVVCFLCLSISIFHNVFSIFFYFLVSCVSCLLSPTPSSPKENEDGKGRRQKTQETNDKKLIENSDRKYQQNMKNIKKMTFSQYIFILFPIGRRLGEIVRMKMCVWENNVIFVPVFHWSSFLWTLFSCYPSLCSLTFVCHRLTLE